MINKLFFTSKVQAFMILLLYIFCMHQLFLILFSNPFYYLQLFSTQSIQGENARFGLQIFKYFWILMAIGLCLRNLQLKRMIVYAIGLFNLMKLFILVTHPHIFWHLQPMDYLLTLLTLSIVGYLTLYYGKHKKPSAP